MPRRRTKIVATIGPASDAPPVLRDLVEAGMDVARLGLAHGPVEDQLERMRRVRRAAKEAGRHVGVLADLPGPKIRAGAFPEGGVVLVEGTPVRLVPGAGDSTEHQICVGGLETLGDLEPGDPVTLGDGAVVLEVEEVDGAAVRAAVRNGGRIQGSPGVHLPSERLRLRAPTEEDLELLDVVARAGVDVVAVSFVRTAGDVQQVLDALAPGRRPMVMAKIETPGAVANLREIVGTSDAVMVARGDLGVECALEEVPHLQKHIIRTGVAFGRPVVTATQMLESMIHAPTPTRAEASDVANAVYDGTDALMLSGETAIGRDPAGAVATMARIARRAEHEIDFVAWGGRHTRRERLSDIPRGVGITDAIAEAAWRAAISVGASAVICCTATGDTARAMARLRPAAPLLGVTPDERTARGLTLSWGVVPLVGLAAENIDDVVAVGVDAARHWGYIERGQVVAVLAGRPTDPDPTTDVLRLVRVR